MDIPLKSLKYLAIDCQATGNSPKSAFPLEIGWLIFRLDAFQTAEPLTPRTLFIHPPESVDIPLRFTKLTGIDSTNLDGAVSDLIAIEKLSDQARRVARENQMAKCLSVIHYSRYEMAFLNELQQRQNLSNPLSLDLFCTHQMATRLLPHLPRKGLRAVAGYLGHSVPKLKRCDAHLLATAYITCKMLEKLARDHDIHTLEQLRHWYTTSKMPVTVKRFPMPSEIRLGLPRSPGIYQMRRSNGDVLYIGKARSLKHRVNSYYQNSRRHSENTLEMLTQAMKLDTICTATALEAALLETDAIKQIQPPYNIALTKTRRSLYFVARNFGTHASSRNKTCRLGPVSSLEPFIAAHLIGQCMRGQTLVPPGDIPTIIAMPESYCPPQECFHSGMAMFRERYSETFRQKSIGHSILDVGRQSWMEKLKHKAASEMESDDAESDTETLKEFVWTPEGVAKTLESVCRRCGFLVRRARCFTMLSESTVTWIDRTPGAERRRVIQLQAGNVTHRFYADITESIPAPPNPRAPIPYRQSQLDIETYDRLRVLTTEIRRLLNDNRFEVIRLSDRTYLLPKQMRRLLDWI